MQLLEKAILMAIQAHQGQQDWAGRPYILHPFRAMLSLETEDEMIVAVLHDVVEDTALTLGDLREAGFSEDVLAAVDCLTRRDDETYEEFIERIVPNPLAVRVKQADLVDNMNLLRINGRLAERDMARLNRYLAAWKRLKPFAP